MKNVNQPTGQGFKTGLYYAGLILLLIAGMYVYHSLEAKLQSRLTTFRLVNIQIQGNHILSRAEVLQLIGVKAGEQLLTVRADDLARRLRTSPYVKNAFAVRTLPSTLRISVEERRPVAFVMGHGLNLIDEDGVILPIPASNLRWDLPLISGIGKNIGRRGKVATSPKIKTALAILEMLSATESPARQLISGIDFSSPHFVQLHLKKGRAVARLNYEDLAGQCVLFSDYSINYLDWTGLNKIDYIDLRFKNQLIVRHQRG